MCSACLPARNAHWKPNLLAPVQSAAGLRYSFRFLEAITKPNGSLHLVGAYTEGNRESMEGLRSYQETFAKDGIFARVALVETRNFHHTLQAAMEMSTSAFFRPNTLFLPVSANSEEEQVQFIVDKAAENESRRDPLCG